MQIMLIKTIKIEALFTKTKMNNDWNVNFLQDTTLTFNALTPVAFYLEEPVV